MIKKIIICFLCLTILFIQLLNAEEKFLSLKKNKTNVRYGPGIDYPIKYIYRKVNLPVKQIDKKENWRRVVFLDNNSGWIHWSQLKPSNSVITKKEKILYTKKTITQDTNDPEIEWVELDVYNFLEDQNNEDKTIH